MESNVGKCSSMKAEIQIKKLVKPSTPTPSHLQSLKISSIDQLQPPFYITLIFHFDANNNHDQETTSTNPEKLAQLEASLAEVLALYYPFAGRFDGEDESAISCQDQGVEFVKATVDGNLCELFDGECDSEFLLSGLSRFSTSRMDEIPLILIQVNAFTCGGLAIGICCHHFIADMFTMSTFMNAWATTCRLGTSLQSTRPSFDLSSLLPPKDVALLPKTPVLVNDGMPPPKFVTKRFTFKGDALSHLKVATVDGKSLGSYTRVELVTALISKAIISIDGLKYGRLRPYSIVHMIHLRKRITLPVKDNSCGNLYMVVLATEQMGIEQLELQGLASLVHTSIRTFSSEVATLKESVAISRKAANAVNELYREVEKGEDVNLMMFSSWCRFPLSSVDFGWGTPGLVSIIPPPVVSVTLMDSSNDENGIDAWVCMKESDMIHFQQDSDIVENTL